MYTIIVYMKLRVHLQWTHRAVLSSAVFFGSSDTDALVDEQLGVESFFTAGRFSRNVLSFTLSLTVTSLVEKGWNDFSVGSVNGRS